MNLFSIFIVAGMLLWLVKPLRTVVVQRTNRTVKALLVAFPVAYAATLTYRFFWGDRDDAVIVGFTVLALLAAWAALVVVGTFLERRAATPRRVEPFGPGSYVPGMPTRIGELGAERVAQAARTRATNDAAVATTTAALDMAIPAAVRALSIASPFAGKLVEIAAPHAVRAAQALAPVALQKVQEAAPVAARAVQSVARGVAQVDTASAAMTVGRVTGRLFAKAKRSFAEGSAPPAPR